MKIQHIPYLLALVFSLFIASTAQAMQSVAIAAGGYHTCALTTAGAVKCWGYNYYGELGDNQASGNQSNIAVDVVGLSNGVSAVAAGEYHTCALTTAGRVKCWGDNEYTQLGSEVNAPTSNVPANVVGLSSGVSAIAAGWYHTCAVTTVGGVKCWGDNEWGQLGDNSGSRKSDPVDVVGLSSGVSAIAAGEFHTCAVTTAGGVECWGYNGKGALGDNLASGNKSNIPVDVVGLSSGVSAIAAGGEYTCALTTAGAVKCWGDNTYGALGDNQASGGESNVPVDVVGLSSGISAIAASSNDTCALTTAGGVQCWGDDSYGQLGDNLASGSQSNVPVDVVGLSSGVSAIAAGGEYTCALTTAGAVKCWGDNYYGELGDNQNSGTQSNVPVTVLGLKLAVKNDFDGDGQSDVLFLNTTTGATRYWPAATKSLVVYPGSYDNTNYSYAGSGDFDGDGKADLLFVKTSNNATLIWSGAVETSASYPGTGTTGFSVAAVCDTDGDGKDDIVWYNATTGQTQIWPSATKANATYPGSQNKVYTVVACSDFDGDGKADLFWHNASSGANQIWLSAKVSTKLDPGTNMDTVVGAGDIDGDGKSDLVWYKPANGAINVWQGGLKSASVYLGTNSTAFTPKAIGDYDGDGKADLLWGNDTTGVTEIWHAFVKANASYPGTYPSGFTIQK